MSGRKSGKKQWPISKYLMHSQIAFLSISMLSYYIHEILFCLKYKLPPELISLNWASASLITVLILFYLCIILIACHIFNLFQALLIYLITGLSDRGKGRQAYAFSRVFPLLCLCIYFQYINIEYVEEIDQALGHGLTSTVNSISLNINLLIFSLFAIIFASFLLCKILLTLNKSRLVKIVYIKLIFILRQRLWELNIQTVQCIIIAPLYFALIIYFAWNESFLPIGEEHAVIHYQSKDYDLLRIYDDYVIARKDMKLRIITTKEVSFQVHNE